MNGSRRKALRKANPAIRRPGRKHGGTVGPNVPPPIFDVDASTPIRIAPHDPCSTCLDTGTDANGDPCAA